MLKSKISQKALQKVEHFTPQGAGEYGLDSHINLKINLVEDAKNKDNSLDFDENEYPSFKVS